MSATGQTMSQVPRAPGNSVSTIRRASTRLFTYTDLQGFDASGSYDMEILFGGAINYNLGGTSIYTDNLPNVAEFTNLFDQFRLRDVVVRIDVPMNTSNSTPLAIPLVYWTVDRDDKASVSLTSILEYERVQPHSFQQNGYKPLIIKLKPTPLKDVAGYGVGTGYSPDLSNPFLRTADMLSIPYYGLKLYADNFGSANATSIPFRVTVFETLQLANPK